MHGFQGISLELPDLDEEYKRYRYTWGSISLSSWR